MRLGPGVGTLADHIERYLKHLIEQADEGFIEIRRSAIAQMFSCVPSQINYVLDTRFTSERGYVVDSRRGGGGCIRILRYVRDEGIGSIQDLLGRMQRTVTEAEADEVLRALVNSGRLRLRDAVALKGLLRQDSEWLPAALRDVVRAMVLRAILLVVVVDRGNR